LTSQRWLSQRSGWLTWPLGRADRVGIQRGAWVVTDQAVVSLASFLATVIVGRMCGRYELGVYGLAISIFWLAAGIPNALVWTPYTSRAARLPAGRRAVFAGSATVHALVIALAISAVVLLVGLVPALGISNSAWFGPMCLALVPFTVMMIVREHVRRISLANLQLGDLLLIDAPIAVTQLVILVWLANVGKLSAVTALLAIALASGGAVVWLARRRDRFQFDRERVMVHWGYNQRFGRWLLFVSIMWLLGDSSFRWLVGSLHGLESLGQFAAAQTMVLFINPFLLSANNLLQALASHHLAGSGSHELRRLVVRGTLMIAVWAGAAFLVLAAVGGPCVTLVFGHEYAGLGRVVATLCLGMFARFLAMPIEAAMVALEHGRWMLTAAVVRLSLIAGAGVPLIWWCGLEGVGYTMALSSAGGAAVQWILFSRGDRHATS
jgi:O-antigen/teichoic acid export membrane protein